MNKEFDTIDDVKGTVSLSGIYKYGLYPEERRDLWEELSGGIALRKDYAKDYYFDCVDDIKKYITKGTVSTQLTGLHCRHS